MLIQSIEPTPNPNAMKLNMSESLPEGVSLSFTRDSAAGAPPYVRRLLAVEGVRSVYQVADFISLEREPRADWQRVLAGARQALESPAEPEGQAADDPPDKVRVLIQTLRGLPMQVKLLTGMEEVRVGLPERFKRAALAVAQRGDLLAERRWEERAPRYGDPRQIGEAVAAEIDATFDEGRLEQMLAEALRLKQGEAVATPEPLAPAVVAERLADPDWRRRFAALDQMEPEEAALEVIIRATADSNASVRRLAVVYLGAIGGEAVLPHLLRALADDSAAVRRAAGDCLSDLGDPAAIGPMCDALQDPSKLVRWRAARYLYEVGDASAIPALRAALSDPEFEVALQARLALERIEEGKAGVEPAWRQMTRLLEE